jgi:photosynthetic reaction center cytochrome c subunit
MKLILQIVGVALALAVVLYFAGSGFVFSRHVWFDSGRPPIVTEQLGRRGTSTVQLYNPREMAALRAANAIPVSPPYAGVEGVTAGEAYENVEVLGDVDRGEFTRLMLSMTQWVAKDEGCEACHNVDDFADDSLYTKKVARVMLRMVRDINANWTQHVAGTGVTCFTCHRGELVPANIWFNNPGQTQAASFLEGTANPRHPLVTRPVSATARDPMTAFLEGDTDIRITSPTSRNREHGLPIKRSRGTHALMIHMSLALGVNCSYCHNTRAFASWQQSRPQRTTAWHGIRMVRHLNDTYLNPIGPLLPPHRLGPAMGDAPKANCATCHNGVFKPLFGEPMAAGFPALLSAPAPQPEGQSAAAPSSMTVRTD